MRAATRVVAALLLILGATAAPAAADRSRPLAVDTVAPDFELADQHGRPLRLSELLDRRSLVVVAFYVKAFTGG